MVDLKSIAATLSAAVILKTERGDVAAEDAADIYLCVLAALERKTGSAQTSPLELDQKAGTTQRTEIYLSENGDRWFLCRDLGGHAYVEHQANRPSGGMLSLIEIQDFLANGRAEPEQRALIALVGNLVGGPTAPR